MTSADAIANPLTNQFLIAMPGLDDPNFTRSVTYICEHNADGAMGIVINHPIEMELGDVLRQLDVATEDQKVEHQPVFIGGPVLPDRGFIVHRPPGNWESSLPVTENIAVTTSRDILNAIAHGYGPRDSIFALGYAGWTAGQLEAEMADNAWLSVPADEHVLFELPASARWRAAAELIGIDPLLLSGDSGHA
ncbi:MAG TPA: YqgE/AlgH family protein [Gammaproteobacteria bacterium]